MRPTRLVGLLVGFALMLGLVLAPAVNAAVPMPTPGGSMPASNFQLCAPGQQNCFPNLDHDHMACIYNDDSTNSNIAFGLRMKNNPPDTYQFLLQRRWIICADASYAYPYAVVIGPGFCMRWIKTATIVRFNVNQPGSTYSLFELEVGSGYKQGTAMPSHEFYPFMQASHSYMISVYRC